ncbi:MAG: MarR family winged helix-turn-helix transcriptional regulator [Eggerthellaceae bacterium]|nr:MarR family winged helix-turn-helix transcriptional regulator [Eggerthellaceae bacterium]
MNDLSILVRQMRVYADRRFSKTESSFSEQLVLMYLIGHGPSSQMQVANGLKIDKGSIAKTVAKMEEKGFVSTEVNEKNRREKIISLAPGSTTTVDLMSEVLRDWEEKINVGIDPEDRKTFACVLKRMVANSSTMIEKEEEGEGYRV